MAEHVYGTRMTDDEIESFLYERGVGVLSLTRDGTAYGVPVSYGYDDERDRCLLDLGFGPASRKREFIETTETGCLTVYEWHSPSEWRSIVLTGQLHELEEGIERELEELFFTYAKEIEMTVFDEPPEEIELQWYELSIEEWSGRLSRK